VGSFNDNGDALRHQDAVQGIGDLRRHSLLNLEPPSVSLYEASQLRDADNSVARQVADMRAPNDRRHVVLATRDEANIAQQHHLIVSSDFLEGAL
jgi:hypothetical protein